MSTPRAVDPNDRAQQRALVKAFSDVTSFTLAESGARQILVLFHAELSKPLVRYRADDQGANGTIVIDSEANRMVARTWVRDDAHMIADALNAADATLSKPPEPELKFYTEGTFIRGRLPYRHSFAQAETYADADRIARLLNADEERA